MVHLMGGLAGFMGTYLIGPRIGRFTADQRLVFILKDMALDNDELELAMNAYSDGKDN